VVKYWREAWAKRSPAAALPRHRNGAQNARPALGWAAGGHRDFANGSRGWHGIGRESKNTAFRG